MGPSGLVSCNTLRPAVYRYTIHLSTRTSGLIDERRTWGLFVEDGGASMQPRIEPLDMDDQLRAPLGRLEFPRLHGTIDLFGAAFRALPALVDRQPGGVGDG